MNALRSAVTALVLGLVTLSGPAAMAATVGITGGETTVTVTAPLGALGLSGAPFSTATADVSGLYPVFTFPITGGSVDSGTGAALIQHDGSGVTLSNGSASATVGNFLIDTVGALVSGDLIDALTGSSLASGLPLFTFGSSTTLPGVELLISSTLAGALTNTFGAPDLTGAQFGFAVPNVAAVPLPAAGLLLMAGVGALGALRSRRKLAA